MTDANDGWFDITLPAAAGDVVASLAASTQSLDPYLLWHSATHPNATSLVPIALQFVPGSGWEHDALLARLVPACYHGARFGTARVDLASTLLTLLGERYNGYIERIRLGRAWRAPELLDAAALGGAPPPLGGDVIAVIDDGCAFANERFRRSDAKAAGWHSRIGCLWDQGRGPGARAPWRPVADFGYGHELVGADIDALLAAHTSGGIVDEDAVYHAAGEQRTDNLALHGTHVLDLAGGADPHDADVPTLIFVQLPREAVRDTSGGWLNTHVLDALWYIQSRVQPDARLVVNLSFGAMAGPHDGSSLLEQAMDDFCRRRPEDFALVLPAGNAHGSDCHAELRLEPGASGVFTWRVRPDDPTDSFIELYLEGDDTAAVRAELLPPALPSSGVVGFDRALVARDAAGLARCALVCVGPRAAEREARIVVMLAPSDPLGRSIAMAPAGDWRLRLYNGGASKVRVPAWIERDGRAEIAPFGAGAQARFVELPAGADVAARLMQERSLNSIAHGTEPIVVGACVGSEPLRMSGYSGSGPARAPSTRLGPDVVAVAEEAPTYDGVPAAGSRSGFRFRLNGSSVAAPQVARRLMALMRAGKGPTSRAQLRATLLAEASAARVQGEGATPERRGAGCVDPEGRVARFG